MAAALPDAVWRADQLARAAGRIESSGHAALDAELPGGGWPLASLTELLLPHPGVGELQLVAPAVSALMRDAGQTVLLGAPHLPYGPGLDALGWPLDRLMLVDADGADRLWCAEQVLRCPAVGALLVWLPRVRPDQLRRLQLAAQTSDNMLVFVLRPIDARAESSPAPLRIACRPSVRMASTRRRTLELDIVKRRGPVRELPAIVEFTVPVSMRRSQRVTRLEPPVVTHVLDRPRVHATADRSAHVH